MFSFLLCPSVALWCQVQLLLVAPLQRFRKCSPMTHLVTALGMEPGVKTNCLPHTLSAEQVYTARLPYPKLGNLVFRMTIICHRTMNTWVTTCIGSQCLKAVFSYEILCKNVILTFPYQLKSSFITLLSAFQKDEYILIGFYKYLWKT